MKEKIALEFKRKGYTEKSVKAYTIALIKLSEFYNKNLEEITFEEMRNFNTHLKDIKKLKSATLNVYKQAWNFWYNKILNKDTAVPKIF